MTKEQIVNHARAKMMRGVKMNPKEIRQYEEAIQQYVNDSRVEVMFLYFAESLKALYGFGWKRPMRAVYWIDSHMREWLDPNYNLDDHRFRAYKNTGVIIAFSEEEQNAIVSMLISRGCKVKTEEDLNGI